MENARSLFLLVAFFVVGCARSSGVAVCDQFLERYASCMTAGGAEATATMRRNLAARRKSFSELAKTEQGRMQLTRQCEASLDALAKSCR
jgi:hypothetical protein